MRGLSYLHQSIDLHLEERKRPGDKLDKKRRG